MFSSEKEMPTRRYMQGTLDFHCGIYCVVNALSCMRGIRLTSARQIVSETILTFAKYPHLFKAFIENNTDHYWVVQYMLARYLANSSYRIEFDQPFPLAQWMPVRTATGDDILANASLFLPEVTTIDEKGRKNLHERAVWDTLSAWLAPNIDQGITKVAVFRFHRYLPTVAEPFISHWTTAIRTFDNRLILHDASSESHAMHYINKKDLIKNSEEKNILIVPESIVLLTV